MRALPEFTLRAGRQISVATVAEKYRRDVGIAMIAPKNAAKLLIAEKGIKAMIKALRSRKSRLWLVYGITLEGYNKIFREQTGCCAICGTHQSELKQKLCIDHNHLADENRGLLCSGCNKGLGFFKDNHCLLFKAARYLKIHKTKGMTIHS